MNFSCRGVVCIELDVIWKIVFFYVNFFGFWICIEKCVLKMVCVGKVFFKIGSLIFKFNFKILEIMGL